MRIHISQADWPTAFNKVAKYVGRHWPTGKQKLSKSREITAKLFGYNSVHDVQKELESTADSKQISIEDMIKSMALKSLVYFECNPEKTYSIFRKIPWKELSIWQRTDEAAFEIFQKNAINKTIMYDEFSNYSNYKSPKALINLFDDKVIPPYKYVVNKEGYIYRCSYLESFINNLDISKDQLREIEFSGSQEEFVREYVLPLIWIPVQDSLGDFNHRNEWVWKTPYMVNVESLSNGKFALYHEGFNAYYPGSYNDVELKEVLISLYTNKNVPKSLLLDIEVDQEKAYKDMDFVPIAGTGTSLKSGSSLVISGQSLIRTQPIKSYKALFEQPWIKKWWWPLMDNYNPVIDSDTLESGIEYDHEMVDRWLNAIHNHYERTIKACDSDSLKNVIAPFFKDTYIDIQTLQQEGRFDIETDDYWTDEDQKEAEKERENDIAELKECGSDVRRYHPEFAPYFDDVALGDLYQDFEGSRYSVGCYERTTGFIVYVFKLRLAKTYSRGGDSPTPIAGALLADLIKKRVNTDDAEASWNQGCDLLEQFRKQKPIMENLVVFAKHRASFDHRYVTHGAPTSLTRQSSAETIQDMSRLFRKTNFSTTQVTQSPDDFSEEAKSEHMKILNDSLKTAISSEKKD